MQTLRARPAVKQEKPQGAIIIYLINDAAMFIGLGKGAQMKIRKKCGLLPNPPRTPPHSLAFFQQKKFTPIFFVENCIFNGRNEFYAWSHFKNK